MPGWDSLETVASLSTFFEIAGMVAIALLVAAGAATYMLWDRRGALLARAERARIAYLPNWNAPDTATLLRNAAAAGLIAAITLLIGFEVIAYQYGKRKDDLTAQAQRASINRIQTETERLRREAADAKASHAAELDVLKREQDARRAAEIAALKRELEQADARRTDEIAVLKRGQQQTEAKRAADAAATKQEQEKAETQYKAEIAELRRTLEQVQTQRASEAAELRKRIEDTQQRSTAEVANLERLNEQTKARHNTVVESLRWEIRQAEAKAAGEIARLQQQLAESEKKIVRLQARRRLTEENKQALIDALRPFAGQKVSIAAIAADDDAKAYAQDFAEVFDAAGWERGAISYQRWDRDPVGIEVTLNETDGRSGRIAQGVGALINAVRKLGLVEGNTIFMSGDVPRGQALLKVGKKLQQ